MSNTFTTKDGRTLTIHAVTPAIVEHLMPNWPIILGNELGDYAEAVRQHALDLIERERMMAPDIVTEDGVTLPAEPIYEIQFGKSAGEIRPTPLGRSLMALAEGHLTNAKKQLSLFGQAESELRSLHTRLQNHEGDADRDAVAGFVSQAGRRQAQMKAALKRALYHSIQGVEMAKWLEVHSGGHLMPVGKEYVEEKVGAAVVPPAPAMVAAEMAKALGMVPATEPKAEKRARKSAA